MHPVGRDVVDYHDCTLVGVMDCTDHCITSNEFMALGATNSLENDKLITLKLHQ